MPQLPATEYVPFVASEFWRPCKANSNLDSIGAAHRISKVFFFLVGTLFSQQSAAEYCAGWSIYRMTACAPTAIGACVNFYETFLRVAGGNASEFTILPNGGQGNQGDDIPVTGPACQASEYYIGKVYRDVYPLWGHADDQYTIKLVPLIGSLESSSIITSVEPDKTAILTAYVYDQNGQVISGAVVKLEVDVVPNSGGHQHDDDRRHTEHMGKLASGAGTSAQNGKVLTGATDAGGFAFSFTAPLPAGDHKIKASRTDRTCTQQGPDTVWIGIKNLLPLPANNIYVLIGDNNAHPDNHYMTYQAHIKLMQLADLYRRRFPGDPLLHVNDASLERGGLFDLAHNWLYKPRGHKSHRRGESVDIRANPKKYPDSAIPERNFGEFKRITKRVGGSAEIHSEGDPLNQHFHVEH